MDADRKMSRLRWQCARRSKAESDYLLGGFLDKYYPDLNPAQAEAFEKLVEMEDLDLWALISGRHACSDGVQAEVVAMLRSLKVM